MESDLPSRLFQVVPDDDFRLPGFHTSNQIYEVRLFAPAVLVFRKVQKALTSLAKLQRSREAIDQGIDGNALSADKVRTALAGQEEAMADIRSFIEACRDSFPTRMRQAAHSHLRAEQVFSTPELLEKVLLCLPPLGLLQAMRINKRSLAIFEGSAVLQERLNLRSRKSGYLENIFSSLTTRISVLVTDALSRRLHGTLYDDDDMPRSFAFHQAQVRVGFDRRCELTIGRRCKSMLFLQPPIVSMKVNVSCCSRVRRGPSDGSECNSSSMVRAAINTSMARLAPSNTEAASDAGMTDRDDGGEATLNAKVDETRRIRCETGITLGHLCDAVRTLREAHRHCADARFSDHDEHGVVSPTFTFTAILDLDKDDPYLARMDWKDIHNQLEKTQGKAQGVLDFSPYRQSADPELTQVLRAPGIMGIYIASKKRASENDWPILTFEEFKAKYDVDGIIEHNRVKVVGFDPLEDYVPSMASDAW